MDILDYQYRPKQGLICLQEAPRAEGYTKGTVHMHDHTEILLITSRAECEIVNNGNRFQVQAPAILMHRSGTFHEVIRISADSYSSYVLHFPEALLADIPKKLLHLPGLFDSDVLILPLTDGEAARFLPLFTLLKARMDNREQQLLLLLCILAEMAALPADHLRFSSKVRETYIFDVVAAIQADPGEKTTTAGLAEQFHVSQTKLKLDFRQITGMSIKAFSIRSRLQKAWVLLESTEDELAEISYACGFSGESHFIETFRKAYGITPGAFRKQKSEKTMSPG